MSEKSERISKLTNKKESRRAYLRSHLVVNIPSQIRALRRRQEMSQKKLADEAEMKQPRISAMERPGETNYNIETLVRLAAAFKVALMVKFVPFSELLRWENDFSQDTFDVVKIDDDAEFRQENEEEAADEVADRTLLSATGGLGAEAKRIAQQTKRIPPLRGLDNSHQPITRSSLSF